MSSDFRMPIDQLDQAVAAARDVGAHAREVELIVGALEGMAVGAGDIFKRDPDRRLSLDDVRLMLEATAAAYQQMADEIRRGSGR